MASLPTPLSFVITGRHHGYNRSEVEAAIARVGGSVQQLVTHSTHIFFDFAENGKGRKYKSWKQVENEGGKVQRLDANAFDFLLNNPIAFYANYMRPVPGPVASPPKKAVDPVAFIPKRSSMFTMNI